MVLESKCLLFLITIGLEVGVPLKFLAHQADWPEGEHGTLMPPL